MFERIGRLAQTTAVGAGVSRRGFLDRCITLAGGAALAVLAVVAPRAHAIKVGPYDCNCHNLPSYGCKSNKGYPYQDCVLACHSACGI